MDQTRTKPRRPRSQSVRAARLQSPVAMFSSYPEERAIHGAKARIAHLQETPKRSHDPVSDQTPTQPEPRPASPRRASYARHWAAEPPGEASDPAAATHRNCTGHRYSSNNPQTSFRRNTTLPRQLCGIQNHRTHAHRPARHPYQTPNREARQEQGSEWQARVS